MIKLIQKNDLKGLKYYLLFASLIIGIYSYSMVTGWRFLSFTEHSKEKTGSRTYIHSYYRSNNHK